jgi:LPXTG-motif cell wall-anchored protein
MDLQNGNKLWFTTTMSFNMEGRDGSAAFNGLYECELNFETGQCAAPEKIVDVFNPANEHHRGLDMMNVRIDNANATMYAGYFDGKRYSFEILRGRLDTPPVVLESFFRLTTEVSTGHCLTQCCEPDLGHHTYYKVEPRDYTVHDGEIFVSWDGFYQNCGDEFAAKAGLKWTVGVSKIMQSPKCVSTGGDHEVSFEDCTVPVSILFQENRARGKILGYSGFQASYTPSGKRMFFLSAMDNDKTVELGGQLFSEIWAMPEGEVYPKNPIALQVFGKLHIHNIFENTAVDDVGTIRLRQDEDGAVTGLCRTAYDVGIACYSLAIDNEERIKIYNDSLFVTAEQVKESCTIPVNEHYPITKHLPPVSTGLEVVWDPTTGGDSPKMLFFGCYGEINNHGNLTTAFRDGSISQTLPGAYAGSILFGPDEAAHEKTAADYDFPPPNTNQSATSPLGVVGFLLLGSLVGLFAKRKIATRPQASSRYEPVMRSEEGEIQFGTIPASSTTSYVELSSKPLENIA